MIEALEKVLMPLAVKIGNNKYLMAIRNGFLVTMPLLIVGSFFLLFSNFPIPGWQEFWTNILGEGWTAYMNKPTDATFALLGLLSSIGIGHAFAGQLKTNQIFGAAVSMVCWFLLMPYEIMYEEEIVRGIPLSWVGSQGIFIAIIVAITSVHIYAFVERKGWVIKMPEGVPPQVERSFAALIPGGAAILVFFIVNIIFSLTPYGNAFTFIYEILQAPLLSLGNTLTAMVVAYLFLHFFWFLGINGGSVVGAVFNPILQTLSAENLANVQAGQLPENIINQQFQDLFATFGGAGSTLSLIIAMFVFCKSERVRELGKLSLLPGIFGINEPIVFGLPIVLNPIMIIPFVLVPTINIVIAYFAMSLGIVPITSGVHIPWTMPVIISGFLSTGIRGAILQAILLVLGVFIYLPFIRILDKQYYEEELAGEKQEA